MTSRRMPHDRLPRYVCGKVVSQHCGQFLLDITPHAIMLRPGLTSRIDIETGSCPEIVAFKVRHILAARARIRRDKDQPMIGAGPSKFTLFPSRSHVSRSGPTDTRAPALSRPLRAPELRQRMSSQYLFASRRGYKRPERRHTPWLRYRHGARELCATLWVSLPARYAPAAHRGRL